MATSTMTTQDAAEFTMPDMRKTNRTGPGRWLISHFMPYSFIGVLLVLGAIGNAYLAGIVPVKIGEAFDYVYNKSPNPLDFLKDIAIFIIVSQIIRGVLQYGRNFSAEWLGQLFERNIRTELFTSLLGKSMAFHNLQPVGDTMARATNDVREINYMFSPGINLVVGSAIFMVMPLVMAPRYHQQLTIIPAVFILLYIVLIWHYLSQLNRITDAVRGAFGKMNMRLTEAIDGIETVKGMSQEKGEIGRFIDNARIFRNAFVAQGDVEAVYLPLLLMGLTHGAGLLHSLILFRAGEISAGDVVAFFGLLALLGFPTFASIFAYSSVSLGFASSRRILELINRETHLDQNDAGYQDEAKGAIEFKGVAFAYDDDPASLEEISFKVEPGQTIAIVGQTGAGKTSLVKLVNRTYDVTEGAVLVDGVDVRDWQLAALRQQVSIIEQDIFLFSRSIAANIAFGKQDATQEEIEEAAKAAQAHEFILDFQDGYETVIGERGVTLSGGQRQRLALARAFLTDPKILVLDDSTSAIDSATEDKIQRAIYAATQGRTTLIITHRLSQIRWADLIVVMKQGKIAAVGTHEDLLGSSEAYRRIFME